MRLIEEVEQGQYILKPIPQAGKRADQMPANEHLSMQLAQQVFGIETAGNALAEGLLPQAQGKITEQFYRLGALAGISKKLIDKLFQELPNYEAKVQMLIPNSFLDEKTKRNYLQAYQTRVRKLLRG